MYSALSIFFAKILLKNKSIEEEYFDVYVFGIEKTVSEIFGNIFLLILALLLNAFFESIIFYYVFYYMRKYAGGYHASTYFNCNAIYLLTFSACLGIYRFYSFNLISFAFLVISFITILLLSPIENPNNPIPTNKFYNYYFLSLMIVGVLCGIVCFGILNNIAIFNFVATTMFASSLFMYVEIIKRRKIVVINLRKKACDLLAKIAEKNAVNSTDEVSFRRIYQPEAPKNLATFKETKKQKHSN